MTTGIASGLGATWGFAQEGTVGTFQAPANWLPVSSDKVIGDKKTVQGQALHGGLFELGAHRRLTMLEAKGPVEMEVMVNQMGLLFKNMLGHCISGPTEIGSSGAYTSIFVPADLTGLSLSLQSGRPMTGGTIQPFSYNGCKITDWEFSIASAEILKLALTFDGMAEATATSYTAPSYTAAPVFAGVDGGLLTGGTVTTTSGVASISGGTAPIGTVKSVSLKGTNAMDTTRQTLGSTTKREQLANAFRKVGGTMVVEFANLTDMYNAYEADSPMTMQLNFTSPAMAGTAENAALNILCPAIYLNGTPPEVDGPGVISVSVPFDVLDDGTDPVIQITTVSSDTTLD